VAPKDISIPFPLSSFPGWHPQEGTGRLINCYAEAKGDEKPVWHRVPGLINYGTTSRSGCRGMIEVNDTLYSAWNGHLEKHAVGTGGASTTVGSLDGSKKGFFGRNNKSPTPDQWFVDPDGNIATFTSTAVTSGWPDADLPAVNATCTIDGYGVFTTGDGRAFATDLNDTTVNALSFGSANVKPDGLIRPVPFGGNLFLFGNYTTEIWADQGLIPFPFQRSFTIQRGLAGPYCVAGQDDGFGKALIWVGDDNRVHRLEGYTPTDISPPDLDRLIEAVTDKTTLEASVYISSGHPFWELSSDTWTWVFDLNNQRWHERQKYLGTRSRITSTLNTSTDLWLCGDTETGNIQQITLGAFDDVGNPLRVRLESGPVENFPNRVRVGRADFDFVTGIGIATGADPIQTDPSVEISWSDDGGVTWGNPILRKLGRQQLARTRVTLFNTGLTSAQGRRWRIDISDPVHVGFLGGIQSTEVRRP
jgi:hypothetical protein